MKRKQLIIILLCMLIGAIVTVASGGTYTLQDGNYQEFTSISIICAIKQPTLEQI